MQLRVRACACVTHLLARQPREELLYERALRLRRMIKARQLKLVQQLKVG